MHRPRGRIGHVDRQALRTGLGAHGGSQINPADHVARTGLVVATVPLIARPCAQGSGRMVDRKLIQRIRLHAQALWSQWSR